MGARFLIDEGLYKYGKGKARKLISYWILIGGIGMNIDFFPKYIDTDIDNVCMCVCSFIS